jgi:hypothetical protein
MSDEPKQPRPPAPPEEPGTEHEVPPFDPDYDLITDMERGTKHDPSKRAESRESR